MSFCASVWRCGRQTQEQAFVPLYVTTALILIFGTSMLVQAMVVPSSSMENNLLVGDHVLVDKLAYAPPGVWSRHVLPYREIGRGDIIVFRYPLNLDEYFVKRVIGVPGDRIRLDAKRVILNGRILDEPYKRNADPRFETFRDWFPHSPPLALPDRALDMLTRVEKGELIVPPGQYFALGDNRDFSLDSRYWGFVPRENIAGRPLLIWWSYDAQHDLRNWNLPHLVDLAQHFVTRSRWNRTLRLIR